MEKREKPDSKGNEEPKNQSTGSENVGESSQEDQSQEDLQLDANLQTDKQVVQKDAIPQPEQGEKPVGLRLGFSKCSVILTSITGANHIDGGLPNQDACIAVQQFYKGKPLTILAVADGHGSKKYNRSETGSFLAVHAAQLTFQDLLMDITSDNLDQSTTSQRLNSIFKRYTKQLHNRWLDLVEKHANDNPEDGVKSDSKTFIQRYGTTLLLSAIYEGMIYMAAIGDGSIYIIRRFNDGRIEVEDVFEEATSSVGLATNSLIEPRAAHKFKSKIYAIGGLDSKIEMLLLTTDGMLDSLEDPSVSVRDIYDKTCQHGLDWLQSILPEQLAKWSDQGVGDDITNIVCFFD